MDENNEVVTAPVEVTQETTAREHGWRPKEEWDGEPSKWVSAETFLAKGELIEKIESIGKKLKEADKTIKMLTEHHQKVKESEFKKAVEWLKAQKKTAYEAGDVDKIIEIDEKIADAKEAQRQPEIPSSTSNTYPAFEEWIVHNSWYKTDSELRVDADAFGNAYATNNPDKTPEEVLDFVTKKIKKLYKDKFENPNRTKAPAVEGSGTRQETTTESFSLTEDERKVMMTFVRQGVMTKEQYMEQLKQVRGSE